ncbi:MAG TPA: hypothetical protein DCM53_00960, partial [Enterobacteriaceae bacterium]|nr:hypothetical protein [Enterobacteriaceae bacterium]
MTFITCQALLALCVLTRTVPAQEPQTGAPPFVAPAAAEGAPINNTAPNTPDASSTSSQDAATPPTFPATLSP